MYDLTKGMLCSNGLEPHQYLSKLKMKSLQLSCAQSWRKVLGNYRYSQHKNRGENHMLISCHACKDIIRAKNIIIVENPFYPLNCWQSAPSSTPSLYRVDLNDVVGMYIHGS